jgi:hypothetical protein
MLGETFDSGALTAPVEQRAEGGGGDQSPGGDGEGDATEASPEEELPEDEWQAQQELFDFSVRFEKGRLTRYRGAGFIQDFRYMLNHTGGVWFYFNPEEKPSSDPKKNQSA